MDASPASQLEGEPPRSDITLGSLPPAGPTPLGRCLLPQRRGGNQRDVWEHRGQDQSEEDGLHGRRADGGWLEVSVLTLLADPLHYCRRTGSKRSI